MGEVYRARDTRLERTVAITVLPQHLSNDPVRRQRFEREAKTISSLNHPHICVLHDIGQNDSVDFLVMECVEGETLAKRLEQAEACRFIRDSPSMCRRRTNGSATTSSVDTSREAAPLTVILNWETALKK